MQTTWNHLRNSFRIIWIMLIHIYSINSLSSLLNAYQNEDKLASTTQFISPTQTDEIPPVIDPQTIINDDDAVWPYIKPQQRLQSTPQTMDNDDNDTDDDDDDGHINGRFTSSSSDDSNDTANSSSSTEITWEYSVKIREENSFPILSYINKTSSYQQVFNPSWIATSDSVEKPGLLVQVQNCSLTAGLCESCPLNSSLIFTECNATTGICDKLSSDGTTGKIPYPLPFNASDYDDNYMQNPSIFYWNDLYYMLVTTLDTSKKPPQRQLQFWSSEDPTAANQNWIQSKVEFASEISGPASLLSAPHLHVDHYLFYGGDGHIYNTSSSCIANWVDLVDVAWLSPRENKFDRDGVESGPPAVPLKDGNYLMLYNGYSSDEHFNVSIAPHIAKHYQIGWLILDGTDPTKILQRSDTPIIAPFYDFENGDGPYTCTQRASVYAKGIVPILDDSNSTDTESFRVYFSAADTSVGTAVITVSHSPINTAFENYFELAIIVSVFCGIFVILMIFIIWCKNKESSQNVHDLITEPEFISIATAHHSSLGASSVHSHTTPFGANTHKQTKRKKYRNETTRGGVNNLNHVHAHTMDCYNENDVNSSLNSATSASTSTSTTLTSSASSSSKSSSSSASSSSYCAECHGKYHHDGRREISHSETMRLSQISFRINETLEKDSPTSTGDHHATNFNFTNNTLGESLL